MTVRALSLTARKRYQMDRLLENDGKYQWPLSVLRQAQVNPEILLNPATLGVVACTNRCTPRPDTTYFPVLVGEATQGKRPPLNLKLRADVFASSVRVILRPASGRSPVEPQLGRLELYPDELTTVPLPADLLPGEYRLEVRATNMQNGQQMSSLLARVVVP